MDTLSNWIFLILFYFVILAFGRADETQMKIDFLKDYFKFEQNTRFLLHVCFPIGMKVFIL